MTLSEIEGLLGSLSEISLSESTKIRHTYLVPNLTTFSVVWNGLTVILVSRSASASVTYLVFSPTQCKMVVEERIDILRTLRSVLPVKVQLRSSQDATGYSILFRTKAGKLIANPGQAVCIDPEGYPLRRGTDGSGWHPMSELEKLAWSQK